MSDLRTAALRALEALERNTSQDMSVVQGNALARHALRAALEEHDKNREWFLERKANWDLQRKLAEETQERDRQQQEYEEQRLAAPIIQPEIKDDKPFGYFRAEPFGWTDCAPTDEGAIPLYERPQKPPTPPEAQTEAEKVAYCAGWWAAMDAKREQK